jgi:hypothetical protein
MARPHLQIEKDVEELKQQVERQDKALRTLVVWLVQAQTGFGQQDAKGIEAILDGTETTSETSPDAA